MFLHLISHSFANWVGSEPKYTPTFKGGTFISDAVVQCLSLSLNKAWTQVLRIANECKLLTMAESV